MHVLNDHPRSLGQVGELMENNAHEVIGSSPSVFVLMPPGPPIHISNYQDYVMGEGDTQHLHTAVSRGILKRLSNELKFEDLGIGSKNNPDTSCAVDFRISV